MNIIIQATLKNLENTKKILSVLSNDQISSSSIPPYYSSVGSHIRHILDFYDCILIQNDILDLTSRKRNINVETNCEFALNYYNDIVEKIQALKEIDLDRIVYVLDDLGLGKTKIKYSFSGLLAQANSHTIHHYAIINYILEGLNIKISDKSFGYNPTTPKANSLN
jgi:hypothetical protein